MEGRGEGRGWGRRRGDGETGGARGCFPPPTALSGPFCTARDVTESFLSHLHKGGSSLPLKGCLLSARHTEAETGELGALRSFHL